MCQQLRSCASCSPDDPDNVPCVIQITRFRIANMCCIQEVTLIHKLLDNLRGVEDVGINLIGRSAIVKHCTVVCCAPSVKILSLLQEQRLGASIQEAGEGDEETNEELMDWRKISIVGLACIFFFAGVGAQMLISPQSRVTLALFVTGTAICVIPIMKAALVSTFIRHTIDIHLLVLLSIAGALALGEYLDACLVAFLFCAADLIEQVMIGFVRRKIKMNSGTVAKKAFLSNGKAVLVDDLVIGDIIAVRAGDMILADGVIIKGDGTVDESSLTGEPMPVKKKKNDRATSGSLMQNGYLEIEIDTDIGESTIRKLAQAVEDVQTDKGEYSKIVDKVALYYTPGVIIFAALFIVIGGAITKNWREYVNIGIVLLVLACPCSIVVATPIPSVCAIAVAARHGALIRGSSVIERLGRIDTIAVDKTGTITTGFFKVQDRLDITPTEELEYDPLELAAALEEKSSHPLADAIVSDYFGCIAEMSGKSLPEVKNMRIQEGVGISGWVNVCDDYLFVEVGNERLLSVNGGKIKLNNDQQGFLDAFTSLHPSASLIMIVVEDKVDLILALADSVRPESHGFVARLTRMGMNVSMLTGDGDNVAKQVVKEIGINPENCLTRLLPADKLKWILETQGKSKKRNVLMLGDGINDTTALAASSVGVAMGANGSAMAVSAADVVLMSNNLKKLPATLLLCQLSRYVIIFNISFSIGIKVIAVILAILGYLQLFMAILIDTGSLIVVIFVGMIPLVTNVYASSDVQEEPIRIDIISEEIAKENL
jgi:Cd2+/Zn2+-exporting ATPase